MSVEKNFSKELEENEDKTGFCVSISSANGKTSLSIRSRINKGDPLSVTEIDSASESQIAAVCSILDNL